MIVAVGFGKAGCSCLTQAMERQILRQARRIALVAKPVAEPAAVNGLPNSVTRNVRWASVRGIASMASRNSSNTGISTSAPVLFCFRDRTPCRMCWRPRRTASPRRCIVPSLAPSRAGIGCRVHGANDTARRVLDSTGRIPPVSFTLPSFTPMVGSASISPSVTANAIRPPSTASSPRPTPNRSPSHGPQTPTKSSPPSDEGTKR